MSAYTDPLGQYATRAVGGPPPHPSCSHVAPESCADCDGTRQSWHDRKMADDQGYRLAWLREFPPDMQHEQADFADNVYGEMPGLRRHLVKRGAA